MRPFSSRGHAINGCSTHEDRQDGGVPEAFLALSHMHAQGLTGRFCRDSGRLTGTGGKAARHPSARRPCAIAQTLCLLSTIFSASLNSSTLFISSDCRSDHGIGWMHDNRLQLFRALAACVDQ